MRCTNCEAENPDGLKFCNQCGTPFASRCPRCGFANAAGAKFCGECGTPLSADDHSSSASSTPSINPGGAPSSPGLTAGGSGGHRFCTSRSIAWIPARGMDCHRGAGGTTVTPAEAPAGVVEIAGYVIRPGRICGNVSLRQVIKKVLGAPAVVVNDDGIVSLLCEKRSELIDQSAAIVWHGNLLARLR